MIAAAGGRRYGACARAARTPGPGLGDDRTRVTVKMYPARTRWNTTRIAAETSSYQETGRRLGLDRRTVREKIDTDLLAELRGEA